MSNKTPQEINDIKMSWLNSSYDVSFHSDCTCAAQEWCKQHCNPWEWTMQKWLEPYLHNMSFQYPHHAHQFEMHINLLGKRTN